MEIEMEMTCNLLVWIWSGVGHRRSILFFHRFLLKPTKPPSQHTCTGIWNSTSPNQPCPRQGMASLIRFCRRLLFFEGWDAVPPPRPTGPPGPCCGPGPPPFPPPTGGWGAGGAPARPPPRAADPDGEQLFPPAWCVLCRNAIRTGQA